MYTTLRKFWKEEEGQAMTEYGIILALIAVVVIATIYSIGQSLSTKFTAVDTELKK